jgi:hypothetical protein
VDADRKELNMGYHFDGVSLGYVRAFQKMNPNWSLVEFKESILTGMRYMTKGMGNDLFGQSRPT